MVSRTTGHIVTGCNCGSQYYLCLDIPGVYGNSCKWDNVEQCEGQDGLCQEERLRSGHLSPPIFCNQLLVLEA